MSGAILNQVTGDLKVARTDCKAVMLSMLRVARWHVAALAGCAGVSLVLGLLPADAAGELIRIWVVGSPYRDEVPPMPAAVHLREATTAAGYDLTIEAFQARGFDAVFADAVARGAAPDLVVFDNFGIMDGITTPLGRFNGIGADPTRRTQFIKVTGVFDDLLGPARGWTYLFGLSPNHRVAKQLALRAPDCAIADETANVDRDLADLVTNVATAYITRDTIAIQASADPDRLPGRPRSVGIVTVGRIRSCGVWRNDKLAIASVNVAYESDGALGDARLLFVFRRPADRWQLLVVTRDPVSTGDFVKDVPQLMARLGRDPRPPVLPVPATLLSPATGQMAAAAVGQRFGAFRWESDPSDAVVAEIAEFAYDEDARLFLVVPMMPGRRHAISAGKLWMTKGEWSWRIWSVSRTGDLAFSEARTFVH